MTAVLDAFERARDDRRTSADDRRILAQVIRTGRIGDVGKLGFACGLDAVTAQRSLRRLTATGHLTQMRGDPR